MGSIISSTTKQLLIVGSLLIVSKLIALFKEVYLAQTFGIGATLDAYFVALSASSIFSAVFLAVLPSVLVPHFIKLNHPQSQNYLLGNLSYFSIIVGLINAFFLVFFSEKIAVAYHYQVGSNEYLLVQNFIKYFATLPIATLLIAVFSSYLFSLKSNANSVVESFPNIILVGAVFLLSASEEKSLAAGTVAGSFLHALCLILICIITYNARPLFGFSKEVIRSMKFIAKGGLILFSGQFFMSLLGPVDNYFAIAFGEGSVAAYNYAMKLVGIGSSLISVLVLRVILPKFSELDRDRNYSEFRRLGYFYTAFSFVVVSIGSLIIFPFLPFFIQLIYQGGKLTPSMLAVVSNLTISGLYQLPFFVMSLIIVQCYLVKNWVFYIALIAISNVIVKFISNLILSELFGLSGLMYSWAIMYFWSGLCLFIIFKIKKIQKR